MYNNQSSQSMRNGPLVPDIKLWRPFRRTDTANVIRLANSTTWRLFGNIDIHEMLELSNHSVVMENDNEQIVACVCLRNYPNIPSVLPEVWPEVFARHYHVPDMQLENTLFIHMLLCDARYTWDVVTSILRSLFLCLFRLKFIVMVVLPNCDNFAQISPQLVGKFFIKVQANGTIKMKAQKLYVTMRQKFLPQLKIRRAVAEDNDDLVSILDRSAPLLKKSYGDFFIAEMVLAQPSEREIIVAETDNHESVGMMCFNQKVSMDNLASNYETGAFHGFRKHSPSEYMDESISGKSLESHVPETAEMINSEIEWGNVAKPKADFTTRASIAYADDYVYSMLERDAMDSDSSFSSETSYPDAEDKKSQLSTFNRSTPRTFDERSTLVNIVKCAEFSTECDVFLIELFGMRYDIDDRMAYALLECGFDTYPKLSYCMISFPSNKRYFPLLSHFVRVIPRGVRTTHPRDMVYVVQRNALLSPIEVRFVDATDELRIRKFHEHMDQGKNHAEEVMTASRHAVIHPNSAKRVYSIIVMCETSMIGVCIVETDNQLHHYRLNYEIDQYIDHVHHTQQESCCLLRMMVLQPAFMPRLPFIVSEIFRRTGFMSMFYKLLDYNGNYSDYIVNTMLMEMIPIKPRCRMTYQVAKLNTDQMPSEKMLTDNPEPSALYHTNVQTCTKRKTPIHDRIIIVGSSSTTLGFLEELLFNKDSKNILFASLTVVSPAGFSAKQLDLLCPLARTFTFSQKYTPQYMRQLSFHTWVNVIFSNVTSINRKEKYVVVEDHTHYYYDQLFMFCGLQFDYPIRLKAPLVSPRNVIFVNNNLEAESLMLKLAQLKRFQFYQIIVYGHYQHSYTCINMMMENGIHPDKLTFIRPRPPSNVTAGKKSMFNDCFIDDLMDNLLENSGIKVLNNYEIVDWIVNEENLVSRIFLESNLSVLDLECSLMVCFERKIVRRKTIAVLNTAGLVFDGRLVINEHFQTSDPCIYSAGPMTKYKRSLFACHMRHENFCSSEIGARVARKYMEQGNPNLPYSTKPRSSHTIPGTTHMFAQPKVIYRRLLDNYCLLYITKPGQALPYDLDKSMEDYGMDLVTGDKPIERDAWGEDINYIRVHLNKYNRVQTILSLTKDSIDVHRYIALWNQHESMLGNLRMRFESDRVPCLYEYFNMAWTHLLYHDRYANFLDPLNNVTMLSNIPTCEMNFLAETMNDIVANKWQRISQKQRATLVERYTTSMYSESIKMSLMEFLADYLEELPMYYKPDKEMSRFSTG